jgi:sugar phosphate permease
VSKLVPASINGSAFGMLGLAGLLGGVAGSNGGAYMMERLNSDGLWYAMAAAAVLSITVALSRPLRP